MFRRLLNRSESRAISYQSLFAAGADLAPRTYAGTAVTQETSLRLGVVYACVRLLSDTVSTLPADTFIRRDGQRFPYRPKPTWVDNPDLGLTREDLLQQVMVSLLLDGNAFIRVFRRPTGEPVVLNVLDPKRVEVRRNRTTSDVEFLIDRSIVVERRDMLHLTELRLPGQLRGVSRIEEVKQTFGLAAALEEFSARFFGNGSSTAGIIETPATLNREQANDIKETFESQHRGVMRSNRVGVLGGGAKFVKTGVDPEDSQLIQSREFAVQEVARIFRIPLHMLQVAQPGAMSYASVEQNAIQFAQYTLRPYVSKIETALSSLLPNEAFLRLNMDGLQRGDLQTRMAAYSTGLQAGIYSVNDVRRLEDLRSIDGGDENRVPLHNVNVSAANLAADESRVRILSALILAGFDPSEALAVAGLPDIGHTGLPSVQLQGVQNVAPDSPSSAYDV